MSVFRRVPRSFRLLDESRAGKETTAVISAPAPKILCTRTGREYEMNSGINNLDEVIRRTEERPAESAMEFLPSTCLNHLISKRRQNTPSKAASHGFVVCLRRSGVSRLVARLSDKPIFSQYFLHGSRSWTTAVPASISTRDGIPVVLGDNGDNG